MAFFIALLALVIALMALNRSSDLTALKIAGYFSGRYLVILFNFVLTISAIQN